MHPSHVLRPKTTALLIVMFFGVVPLAGCPGKLLPGEEVAEHNIVVHNRTARPLTFEMVLPDRTFNLRGPIGPGQSGSIRGVRGSSPLISTISPRVPGARRHRCQSIGARGSGR